MFFLFLRYLVQCRIRTIFSTLQAFVCRLGAICWESLLWDNKKKKKKGGWSVCVIHFKFNKDGEENFLCSFSSCLVLQFAYLIGHAWNIFHFRWDFFFQYSSGLVMKIRRSFKKSSSIFISFSSLSRMPTALHFSHTVPRDVSVRIGTCFSPGKTFKEKKNVSRRQVEEWWKSFWTSTKSRQL